MKDALSPAELLDQVSEQFEFLDRDLSWLEFNRRVLHEALDPRTPLLERLLFLGIFTSNLDEFFMKRVAGFRPSRQEKPRLADYEPPIRRLTAIRESVLPMLRVQARVFQNEIRTALAERGIHLLAWEQVTPAEQEQANRYFRDNVFPVLTPQSVDPSHPFPFMSNLSVSLAVALSNPYTEEKLFARVKVPKLLPQWIELTGAEAGQRRFVSLREMIQHNLPLLFSGMTIREVMPVRVTRSAAVDYDLDEDEDLLEMIEEELKQRRMQQVIRLEHRPTQDRWLLDMVVERLDLPPDRVYELEGELDYTDFAQIAAIKMPELRYTPWTPTVPPALSGDDGDIFALIRSGDLLVHHPYESFDASVCKFIRAAVDDPNVLAIKMIVYRTSDDSPFVPLLIQAAEQGKQVACLVELLARFDEQRNIRWANALEDAGVHVVYGILGVKTHSKAAVVVRREPDGLRTYAHIGTGNYNPQTAKLYTDLGLFTCHAEIAGDVVELFHSLTGRSLKQDYDRLLVAPINMKERFLAMIQRERENHLAGQPAHIVAKMNQIEDREIVRALYQASQAGVPIDLVIRGFCTLRPQMPELSPTIRVISVVGRFLEHSRVFYFRNGTEDPIEGEFYIGSADWMYRNLESRVEAITPILNRGARERCWELLQILLADERQAWDMQPDGTYQQRRPTPETDPVAAAGTQQVLMDRTRIRNESGVKPGTAATG